MEVRIGVQNTSREVVIDVNESADFVTKAVNAALAKGEVLSLTDERGRTVVVPAASIAYIDIAASESRKVGFGA
ncbi:MAG: hypothetical protein RL441_424 [Actinomycetota bacterium]|jgi:hypothetical protein